MTSKKDLSTLPRPVVALVGKDGNAFSILGRTMAAMRKAGWSDDEINQFHAEATSGNYDNLLGTVIKYCDEPRVEETDDDYDFE